MVGLHYAVAVCLDRVLFGQLCTYDVDVLLSKLLLISASGVYCYHMHPFLFLNAPTAETQA